MVITCHDTPFYFPLTGTSTSQESNLFCPLLGKFTLPHSFFRLVDTQDFFFAVNIFNIKRIKSFTLVLLPLDNVYTGFLKPFFFYMFIH